MCFCFVHVFLLFHTFPHPCRQSRIKTRCQWISETRMILSDPVDTPGAPRPFWSVQKWRWVWNLVRKGRRRPRVEASLKQYLAIFIKSDMVCSVVQSENYTSNQTGKTIRGHSTRFSCPVRFWMRLHALEFTVYGMKMDEWMHLTVEVFEQSWDWVPRSEKVPRFEEQNVAGSCKTVRLVRRSNCLGIMPRWAGTVSSLTGWVTSVKRCERPSESGIETSWNWGPFHNRT